MGLSERSGLPVWGGRRRWAAVVVVEDGGGYSEGSESATRGVRLTGGETRGRSWWEL